MHMRSIPTSRVSGHRVQVSSMSGGTVVRDAAEHVQDWKLFLVQVRLSLLSLCVAPV